MENEEKIVAPEEVLNEAPTEPANQETEDVEEPALEDRVNAIEGEIQEINGRFDDIISEQEKIVTVLDKISDKILSTEITPKTEEVAENAAKPKDEEENEEVEEAPETEEPESEEETEDEEKKAKNAVEAEEPAEPEEKQESEESTAEQPESAPEDAPAEEEVQENNTKGIKMTKEELQEILNSFKSEIKNEILDAKVEEPEVKEAPAEEEKAEEPEVAKNWRQRYNDQVAAAWDFHRLNNIEAGEKLRRINQYNADLRKNDAGTAPVTITSLADFVLPPEMDKEIYGLRTNYSPLLSVLRYQETQNLQFIYVTRVGDINMQSVKFCDDGLDGNLKPVETYGLKRGIAQMEEMAAVTPICDNATKYMAVDYLQDLAEGYRNDYDRKLAQLAIVRFQQAINETGNTIQYDPATAVDGLVDFVKATTLVSDSVVNGKFMFNARTKALLLENLLRSGNDGLGEKAFTTGNSQTIWGYDYVVVPNDLLPTLGTDEVKTFTAMNNATGVVESVNITTPVFYGDFNAYRGKVSGGLKYTLSTEAAYEINGETRSAFQRDELIARGYFYRGGYIADPKVIAGLVPASA